ncbi:MAG: patatin-like phospholipase family protein [Brachyspira sp.]|nr:patatin-like phospholipase family protein [Brachyspira sp.]
MNKKSFEYTCLFGGGAIRGAAYCGTLKAMEELGINPNTVAGSSVGSVIAGLIAVGYNAEELKDVFMQVNFELFRDLQFAIGPQFALSKGEVFLDWLRELIEKKYYGEKYKKGSHKAVTFNDLDKNLVIITTDLSSFECKEFSKCETPDFEVATAIRISCSMPGLMKPYEYNNRVLVDGDLQKSSPMWKLSKTLQPKDERILEFRLEGDFEGNEKNTIEYINSLYSYATIIATEFIMDIYNNKDKFDYIVINTGDINIVDFNLAAEKRVNLMEAGYQQTIDYFTKVLPKKKEHLLEIYAQIEQSLKKVKKNLSANNLQKGKYTLAELFVYLCDYVSIIDKKDYEAIKEFKNAFYDNIIHPALFGKSKLKNEKYVSCSLEQLILQISAKVQEFKDFLEN